MEKRLSQLFDFQKYEDNAQLRNVIESVRARYQVRELDLGELKWVAAAGEPDARSKDLFRRSKTDDR